MFDKRKYNNIVGLLILAIVFLGAFLTPAKSFGDTSNIKISVLEFINESDDPNYDYLSASMQNSVYSGLFNIQDINIIQNSVSNELSNEIEIDFHNVENLSNSLRFAHAGKINVIISGKYNINENNIIKIDVKVYSIAQKDVIINYSLTGNVNSEIYDLLDKISYDTAEKVLSNKDIIEIALQDIAKDVAPPNYIKQPYLSEINLNEIIVEWETDKETASKIHLLNKEKFDTKSDQNVINTFLDLSEDALNHKVSIPIEYFFDKIDYYIISSDTDFIENTVYSNIVNLDYTSIYNKISAIYNKDKEQTFNVVDTFLNEENFENAVSELNKLIERIENEYRVILDLLNDDKEKIQRKIDEVLKLQEEKLNPVDKNEENEIIENEEQNNNDDEETIENEEEMNYEEDLSQDIQNIITEEQIDLLEKEGFEIYEGKTPPKVEGVYLLNTNYCEFDSNNYQDWYTSHYLYKFYNQDENNNTITLSYRNIYGNDSGEGVGAFLSGKENKFSLFIETSGLSDNNNDGKYVPYKTIEVFSGEIIPQGIKNLEHSFLLKDKGEDVDNEIMKINDYRIFKEKDGIAELLVDRQQNINNADLSKIANKLIEENPDIYSNEDEDKDDMIVPPTKKNKLRRFYMGVGVKVFRDFEPIYPSNRDALSYMLPFSLDLGIIISKKKFNTYLYISVGTDFDTHNTPFFIDLGFKISTLPVSWLDISIFIEAGLGHSNYNDISYIEDYIKPIEVWYNKIHLSGGLELEFLIPKVNIGFYTRFDIAMLISTVYSTPIISLGFNFNAGIRLYL